MQGVPKLPDLPTLREELSKRLQSVTPSTPSKHRQGRLPQYCSEYSFRGKIKLLLLDMMADICNPSTTVAKNAEMKVIFGYKESTRPASAT